MNTQTITGQASKRLSLRLWRNLYHILNALRHAQNVTDLGGVQKWGIPKKRNLDRHNDDKPLDFRGSPLLDKPSRRSYHTTSASASRLRNLQFLPVPELHVWSGRSTTPLEINQCCAFIKKLQEKLLSHSLAVKVTKAHASRINCPPKACTTQNQRVLSKGEKKQWWLLDPNIV